MRVLVTPKNIIEYGLDVITGNTRADLLARAAEMGDEGYELWVVIPDAEGGDTEAPDEVNIFDVSSIYGESGLNEPEGASHLQEALDLRDQEYIANPCSYRWSPMFRDWICLRHNRHSKHSIEEGSHAPCLAVDP